MSETDIRVVQVGHPTDSNGNLMRDITIVGAYGHINGQTFGLSQDFSTNLVNEEWQMIETIMRNEFQYHLSKEARRG